MARPRTRTLPHLLSAAIALLLVSAACGNDDVITPQDDLGFLVGDWDAVVLEVTNQADPTETADLLEAGATFRINVQPSGQYTATLTFLGTSIPEIGTLKLEGNQLTFFRSIPSTDTSHATLTQLSEDRVRLEGLSSFDFDLDGVPEDADLLTELVRDEG